MRRSLAILLTGGFLLLYLVFARRRRLRHDERSPRRPFAAAGSPNTPGLGLICQVTVVNRITSHGGTATVVVRECHGAAGAPTASCKVTTWNLTRLVTKVTQCNDALNGGGATVRCSVRVTNDFVGMSTGATAATVNQCVGSGSITVGCDPFPATTTGASITQCNGSANGGTLVRLQCTASGTRPSSRGVRINQCNGSANGGGALVICSASIRNVRVKRHVWRRLDPDRPALRRGGAARHRDIRVLDRARRALPLLGDDRIGRLVDAHRPAPPHLGRRRTRQALASPRRRAVIPILMPQYDGRGLTSRLMADRRPL